MLIGDYDRLRKWTGVENDGTDYRSACELTALDELATSDAYLLVWDFGGPGTSYILYRKEVVTCIRLWANSDINDDDITRLADTLVFNKKDIRVQIPSGRMVFLWAPEDGTTITEATGDSGVPVGDFSMAGTAHFQKLTCGTYQGYAATAEFDEIQITAIRFARIS